MTSKWLVGVFTLMVAGQGVAIAESSRQSNIQERQQNFKAMGAAFKGVNDQMRRPSADIAAIRQNAARLNATADRFATQNWFPKGTGPESGQKTDAKPEIWTQSQQFGGMRAALRTQTRQLNAAAASGDMGRIKLAVKAVGQSCAACHKQFRNDD